MRTTPTVPAPTVPYGADQTIYVVVDGCEEKYPWDRNDETEQNDVEAIISDLLAGRFRDPLRVIAFNTLEHWSSDMSTEIAGEIQSRCDGDGCDIPSHLAGFMEMNLTRPGHPTRRRA